MSKAGAKKWYAFMKWFETRDDTLLDIIRE